MFLNSHSFQSAIAGPTMRPRTLKGETSFLAKEKKWTRRLWPGGRSTGVWTEDTCFTFSAILNFNVFDGPKRLDTVKGKLEQNLLLRYDVCLSRTKRRALFGGRGVDLIDVFKKWIAAGW